MLSDFSALHAQHSYWWAMGRFTHGYDNYIRHAFPHDELKPLSLSHTDSLGAHAGYPLNRCI